MRGLDDDLESNLRTFCDQDYPDYQILFGVESESEPCVSVIRTIVAEFPEKDLQLVVCPPNRGSNRKVGILKKLLAEAKHDVLVWCDSDIRIGADHLKHIVAPLHDPKVGLVCCPYRWKSPQNVPAALESLTFSTEFIPSVLMLERLGQLKFALGASMALRRGCLEEIGGLEMIEDYLADDYELGKRITESGYRLVLTDYLVDLIHPAMSWKRTLLHQLRLVRTYKVCRPMGFFFSVLTHGTTWATVFLVANAFSALGWSVWTAVVALRIATATGLLLTHLPDFHTTGYLWLLPFRDWFSSLLWMLAYTGNTITWRGRSFLLTKDGKLREMDDRRLAGRLRSATLEKT